LHNRVEATPLAPWTLATPRTQLDADDTGTHLRLPTPLALIELIAAVAVAAVAGVPAKRKLATNIIKIAFKKSRMLAPSPSSAGLLGG
jgi:hypothetical protein